MYRIDFNKPEHMHFIGIGGINVSDLAEVLLDEGFSISGSDSHETALTEYFETKGARVYYGQRAANIERKSGISVVVYTAAIHEDNPEFRAARDQGPPMLSRVELLEELMHNYKEAIAIPRTHGKTITTPTLTDILLAGDLDPTIFVGGILKGIGGNIRVDGPDLFVAEACEYANSFLSFYPTMEVILSVEEGHLNFLRDIEDIRHFSRLFAEKFSVEGLLVVNSGVEKVEEIARGLRCRMATLGKNLSSTYMVRNITYDGFARPSYGLVVQGETVTHITLGVAEEYNVYNPLAAIAIALELRVGFDAIMSGLGRFTGADRWFEKKGEVAGVTVIDDYTYCPQEIKAASAATRNYPHRKLWCVFQPHTCARTRAFLDQFAEVLFVVDEMVLADIYAARETDTLGVSSRDVADRTERLGTKIRYIPSFDEIEALVLKNCMNGDLLIIMGARDIVKVGEKLLG